jgi:hypothetical protein
MQDGECKTANARRAWTDTHRIFLNDPKSPYSGFQIPIKIKGELRVYAVAIT